METLFTESGSNVTSWMITDGNLSYTPTNGSVVPPSGSGYRSQDLSVAVRITLYSVIFFLAVVGNALVIVTLARNRRMRTVTNVFLMNLSISDLLLAVFCMPFTLIPTLLRNFIFGKAMCVLLRYIQAVSVGVSVFTLVAISLERYFAICQPLRSRTWQTLSHSYRTIGAVWFISMVIMIPIAVFQRLYSMKESLHHKCREEWRSQAGLWVYTVFLDLALLISPLLIMLWAYGMISETLWRGIRLEMRSVQEMAELRNHTHREDTDDDVDTDEDGRCYENGLLKSDGRRPTSSSTSLNGVQQGATSSRKRCLDMRAHMRHTNTEKSLQAKKRVIRMLFVLVVEFFVCWTPTYILQTWVAFDERHAMNWVSPVTMNLIHLLSYVSSCCNPITYCFMNRKFRQGFMSAFHCCACVRRRVLHAKGMTADHSYVTSQRTAFTSLRYSADPSYSEAKYG